MHLGPGGECAVFGMLDNRAPGSAAIRKGIAHQGAVGHAVAVIRVCNDPGICEFDQVGECLALAPPRDGADDVDANRSLASGGVVDEVDNGSCVDGRFGIGHGADRGEPPGGGRGRPGCDRFTVFEARLTEMGV